MCVILCNIAVIISIHALLAESDLLGRDDDMTQLEFLSTLSLRRATMGYPVSGQHYSISIHALLAESDPRKAVTTRGNHRYFYPRSPCGERRWSMSAAPPARPISIHALLAESDRRSFRGRRCPANFYPRSPCGERRAGCGHVAGGQEISIHALLAESDCSDR